MFDTCYTNNESCFSFDNAACETIRTNKGRRSLVSRDRRSCKGGDDSYAKNFVSSCSDVPSRAEYLARRSMQRNAQRAVSALHVNAAWNLTARVALREAARNSIRKLAAAVIHPLVWLPVRADDVAVKDSAAYTQCGTGSLSPRMEDHEGWWHSACVYMTVYGPEKQERRECSAVKSAWYVAKRAAVDPVWYVGKPAAVKGAAHAVRSARARKGWETRRRNAARVAEILNATCEPLVTTADALPASVAYSATPGSECCHGRTAHGADGRVGDAHVLVRPDTLVAMGAWWDNDIEQWRDAPSIEGQWCNPVGADPRPTCPRVVPCDPRDTYAVMWDTLCLTPAEGRRERRNARRRELYRLRKAA